MDSSFSSDIGIPSSSLDPQLFETESTILTVSIGTQSPSNVTILSQSNGRDKVAQYPDEKMFKEYDHYILAKTAFFDWWVNTPFAKQFSS